jgi:hypothetical protein
MPAMVTMLSLRCAGLANIGFDGKPMPSGGKLVRRTCTSSHNRQEQWQMQVVWWRRMSRRGGRAKCRRIDAAAARAPSAADRAPNVQHSQWCAEGDSSLHPAAITVAAICHRIARCSVHSCAIHSTVFVGGHQLSGCHPPQAPMKHRSTRAAPTTGGCTPRSSSSTTPCGARAGLQTQGT